MRRKNALMSTACVAPLVWASMQAPPAGYIDTRNPPPSSSATKKDA